MLALSKAFQTAKAELEAKKAEENEKITKDKHAGAGALGAGRQMMQAAADEGKKQMQVEKNEKHGKWSRRSRSRQATWKRYCLKWNA